MPSGNSWWETFPPTRMCESNRVKRSRLTLNVERNIKNKLEEVDNQPYYTAPDNLAMEEKKEGNCSMQFDPWEDTKV